MSTETGRVLRLWRGEWSRATILLALVGVWGCLVLTQLTPCVKIDTDTGAYLALAQSLAEGRGYTLEGSACRFYPPFFPLMLSVAAFSDGYLLEKAIIVLTALGASLGAYLLLRQRHAGREAAILALLVAVSPAFLDYCARVRPDIPFTLFSMLFLVLANKFWRALKINWPLAVGSMAALALAAVTRSAAYAFYVATVGWLLRPSLWRKDARRCIVFIALFLIIACPPVLGWAAWVRSREAGATGTYATVVVRHLPRGKSLISAQALSLMATRWVRSVPVQVRGAAWSILRAGKGPAGVVWTFLVLPIVLLGLVRRLRAPELPDYCYCAYGVMVLLWPWPQGFRFWVPVLPLTLGYLADGMKGLGGVGEDFPWLVRRRWMRRLDNFLGRFRDKVVWAGAIALLFMGVAGGISMVAKSWKDCRAATSNVILAKSPLAVARYLDIHRDLPVVLAYWRSFEVKLALTDWRGSIVSVPRPADEDALAYLRKLRLRGVTHLAMEPTIKDPLYRRGEMLEAVRDLLMRKGDQSGLVHVTEDIQIFELPQGELEPESDLSTAI